MPLEITKDRVTELLASVRSLGEDELLVGIPADNDPREDASIGNAALGYLHETGAPGANIPARPWLEPGVRKSLGEVTEILKTGALRAVEHGDTQAASGAYTAAGFVARNSVIEYLRSNIPPPLAPATIARRRQRSPGSSYRRRAIGVDDVTALIDTAQMLNATTFVKRKRGA